MYGSDNQELWDAMQDEGWDYILVHKISISKIEDPKTRELAFKASNAFSELEEYLHPLCCRECD